MSKVKDEEFDDELVKTPILKGEERVRSDGLVASLISASAHYLRPLALQIAPLVICTLFIPIVLSLSGLAGYFVWNSLAARWHAPIHLQYGDGVPPYAHFPVSNLHPQQPYEVSLHLVVPATESNLALGNFMASLRLSTPSNKTLVSVRRPAVAVAPRSWWILGPSNVITVDIPLLEAFVPGSQSLIADVKIGRKDNWKSLGNGEMRELSVVSASLNGLVVPHGIRGIAIRFPLVSSFAAAFTFLSICTLILGVCILPIMLSSDSEEATPSGTKSSATFPASQRRQRSQFKHSSEEFSEPSSLLPVKQEPVMDIPPAEEPMPERIRQRNVSIKRESDDDS